MQKRQEKKSGKTSYRITAVWPARPLTPVRTMHTGLSDIHTYIHTSTALCTAVVYHVSACFDTLAGLGMIPVYSTHVPSAGALALLPTSITIEPATSRPCIVPHIERVMVTPFRIHPHGEWGATNDDGQ